MGSLVGAITTSTHTVLPMRLGLNPLGKCFPWLVDGESTLAWCHPFSNEQMCNGWVDPSNRPWWWWIAGCSFVEEEVQTEVKNCDLLQSWALWESTEHQGSKGSAAQSWWLNASHEHLT